MKEMDLGLMKGEIAMTVQFRNLIFEGGGVKGIAYVGAMRILEQRGALQNIVRGHVGQSYNLLSR